MGQWEHAGVLHLAVLGPAEGNGKATWAGAASRKLWQAGLCWSPRETTGSSRTVPECCLGHFAEEDKGGPSQNWWGVGVEGILRAKCGEPGL